MYWKEKEINKERKKSVLNYERWDLMTSLHYKLSSKCLDLKMAISNGWDGSTKSIRYFVTDNHLFDSR